MTKPRRKSVKIETNKKSPDIGKYLVPFMKVTSTSSRVQMSFYNPFNDGNGRMSRLLKLLLLYREGYIAGKYISLEMMIEKTKESYYETLAQSSHDWHMNENNYAPFVSYYLSIILAVYKEFESRVDFVKTRGVTKLEFINPSPQFCSLGSELQVFLPDSKLEFQSN